MLIYIITIFIIIVIIMIIYIITSSCVEQSKVRDCYVFCICLLTLKINMRNTNQLSWAAAQGERLFGRYNRHAPHCQLTSSSSSSSSSYCIIIITTIIVISRWWRTGRTWRSATKTWERRTRRRPRTSRSRWRRGRSTSLAFGAKQIHRFGTNSQHVPISSQFWFFAGL